MDNSTNSLSSPNKAPYSDDSESQDELYYGDPEEAVYPPNFKRSGALAGDDGCICEGVLIHVDCPIHGWMLDNIPTEEEPYG